MFGNSSAMTVHDIWQFGEEEKNNNSKCRRIRAESFNGLKHISFLGKFFFCVQNKHVSFSYMYIYNPSLIKPILYKKAPLP